MITTQEEKLQKQSLGMADVSSRFNGRVLGAKEQKEEVVAAKPEEPLAKQLPIDFGLDVIHGPNAGQFYPIIEGRIVLGRSHEADIQISSPAVSRKQLECVAGPDGMFITNLSTVTPVYVGGRLVHDAQIFDGDEVTFADVTMGFRSNRPQDYWPKELDEENCDTFAPDVSRQNIVVAAREQLEQQAAQSQPIGIHNHKHSNPAKKLVLFALAILVMAAFYQKMLKPWQVNSTLQELAFVAKSGEYTKTAATLNELLATNLSSPNRQLAKQLLQKTTLMQARKLVYAKNLTQAAGMLSDYLKRSEVIRDSEAILSLQDSINFQLGEQLAAQNKLQKATEFFVAIRPESVLYNRAQDNIQNMVVKPPEVLADSGNGVEIAGLMQKAEALFRAQRFLRPSHNSAYGLYKKILQSDPGNTIALARIEAMKSFYHQAGDKYAKFNDFQKSLTYYRRYLLLEPDNEVIQNKAKSVSQKLAQSRGSTALQSTAVAPVKIDNQQRHIVVAANGKTNNRRRVKELLQTSDVKSEWIADYLYGGSDKQEVPWH